MATNVYLPWRPQPSRIPAFQYTAAWWERHGFTVHIIDSRDEPFSLAATRNLAVERANGPVVIADADTVGTIEAINEALDLTTQQRRTYLPYTDYRSLGETGTAQALAGTPLHQCQHFSWPPAVSGIYITTPQAWNSYGGQDPRFKGWLGEDIAHQIAHETLNGPLGRTNGTAYALGHTPATKHGTQYDANLHLMNRYIAANGDVNAITELIAER